MHARAPFRCVWPRLHRGGRVATIRRMTKRASKDEWEAARQRWEADATLNFTDLSATLGVSKQAVAHRANKEGWQRVGAMQNMSQRAQLMADKRQLVSDNKIPLNVQRSAGVIDAATEIRASLLERHRKDWEEHRERFPLEDLAGGKEVTDPKTGEKTKTKGDFEQAKCAKITSEMISIRQQGERKAYGLDEPAAVPGGQHTVVDVLAALAGRLPG